ncbi:TrmH family RNA methyltransferase [Candidatus Saccharibacteria bacterium]|nr:TrmH family RNA methyltransferase [Candidatus Saccharibacteria bacterium]
MRQIIVIAHNMRSTHNVGSLLRTAEGLGIKNVYLTGYTPYPFKDGDGRLPHLSKKLHTQIQKTALGAEVTQVWIYAENLSDILTKLKKDGFTIAALEKTTDAMPLSSYKSPDRIALLLGNEVTGIPKEVLKKILIHLYIPMSGKKESFNVVQAAAMALYQLRFL